MSFRSKPLLAAKSRLATTWNYRKDNCLLFVSKVYDM